MHSRPKKETTEVSQFQTILIFFDHSPVAEMLAFKMVNENDK